MLNNIGLPGLLLIAVVVLVLFGRGKISSLMGEVGKGITAFKRGVDDSKKELEDGSEHVSDITPAEHNVVTPPSSAGGAKPDATLDAKKTKS